MAYQTAHVKSDDPAVTKFYNWRTAETCAAYLIPHLKPHFNVLDVGSGPGSISRGLASLCPQGKVTGVDISPGVVAQAAAEHGAEAPNLSFQVGNAEDLSQFPDNSFDVVHGHAVVIHLPNPAKAFKEFYRVCKPGGVVATRDTVAGWPVLSLKPDLPAIREVLPVWLRVLKHLGSDPDASLYKKQWAREAGFREEDMIVSESGMPNRLPFFLREGPVDEWIRDGLVTREQVERSNRAWEEWESTEGHEFVLAAQDLLCFKRA